MLSKSCQVLSTWILKCDDSECSFPAIEEVRAFVYFLPFPKKFRFFLISFLCTEEKLVWSHVHWSGNFTHTNLKCNRSQNWCGLTFNEFIHKVLPREFQCFRPVHFVISPNVGRHFIKFSTPYQDVRKFCGRSTANGNNNLNDNSWLFFEIW